MIENHQILAVTGHRPDKLGGYSNEVNARLVKLGEWLIDHYQPRILIIGMALGFDQACAQAAINKNIPFIAAVPHADQPRLWPEEARRIYYQLLEQAGEVVNVEQLRTHKSHPFKPRMLHQRNEYMVDRSTGLIALWNGDEHGGTASCIRYAIRRGIVWENIWEKWLEINREKP